jgi:hypothetical protein
MATTTTTPLESSKVIPVRAYHQPNDSDVDMNDTTPPEYVMIELNGELIPPVEYPSPDICRTILGKDDGVELGKLHQDNKNNASPHKSKMARATQG